MRACTPRFSSACPIDSHAPLLQARHERAIMPDLDDEEANRRATTTPTSQPVGGLGPNPIPPQISVPPPVLASGGLVSPELEAPRIANARHLAENQRPNNELTLAQREERLVLSEAQESARKALASPRTKLSDEDRAFVDPTTEAGQRNLRRASDPDKKLSPSTIDEARTIRSRRPRAWASRGRAQGARGYALARAVQPRVHRRSQEHQG